MPIAEPLPVPRKRLGIRPRTDDAALVRRMQTGEESSFEAIYKRHHAPLLSYCRHMLSSQDEAEDVLQQAFIKAHGALLGGSAPRELRPWLYAIARNCCLTAIAARRPTAPLEDRTPALAGLSDQVHQREDLRELVAGIGRLPEDQRSALLLAELDDLPHQAIATIVGCEVSKVKALVYQARSALIADRDAQNTPCQDIREQLSVAHAGELRRGPLRRHLKLCVGCRDFQLAVGAQRQSLGVVLPVLPSAGLAAAILGHGAAHAVTGASLTGASAGATATGATGIAATGPAASTALVGGGLVTKLALVGTVVAVASAGAVTVHDREAHATPQRAAGARLASTNTPAVGYHATDVANRGRGPSGSLAPRSPAAPAPSESRPLDAAAGSSGSLTEPPGLSSAGPLLRAFGTPAPSGASSGIAAPGGSGQPAGSVGPRKSGTEGEPATRAEHRAELARRRAQFRRKAFLRQRALLRRRALLRHRALLRREALLRRQLAARRRARREALERRRQAAEPPASKPAVTPAPARGRHRKAPSTQTSGSLRQPTGTPVAEKTEGRGAKGRRNPAARPKGSGTGTGTGMGAGTGMGSTGAGSGAGTGTGPTGPRKGKAGSKAVGGEIGSGTTPGAGSGKAEGAGGSTPSRTKAGGGETSGTGKGSRTGTSGAGESSGTAGGAGGTSGAGPTTGTGAEAPPKKHLVEEGQLPNL